MSTSPFNFGLLIEAEDLVPFLGHEKLRIVDLSRNSVYEQLHLPHALQLKPSMLLRQDEHTSGLLPEPEALQDLIQYLNISPEHHVVAYDDEGGAWAGRLIWNLHCLGFENTSLLNGGIHAWLAAGFPSLIIKIFFIYLFIMVFKSFMSPKPLFFIFVYYIT